MARWRQRQQIHHLGAPTPAGGLIGDQQKRLKKIRTEAKLIEKSYALPATSNRRALADIRIVKRTVRTKRATESNPLTPAAIQSQASLANSRY